MKSFKRFSLLVMAGVLIFVMGGGPVSAAIQTTGGLTENQEALVFVLGNHLDGFTDSNGNSQVKIVNPAELEKNLENIDIDLTFKEFQSAITNFNSYMADPNNNIIKETSDDLVNEMREDIGGGISLMSACSNALTIIGLLHSGSYTAAASIAIPVIVGAAYSLFSLAC